jgi:hypothetical protein
VYSAIVRLLRLASILACTIVVVSFTLFAINQTNTASTRQQQAVTSQAAGASIDRLAIGPQGPSPSKSSTSNEGPVRKTIDEAAEWLTSPFAGVTSGSHSEWAIRGVGLLLALVAYGFGVGFLARSLRVRV